MRNEWLLLCGVVLLMTVRSMTCENINDTHNNESNSEDMALPFSPRMDYDQWRPLGRGDPLKNDPTYDYVPPVLDRVHYWIEPAQRKPDPPLPTQPKKTEILLLGVTAKKTNPETRKDFDTFLKFVDGPKFNSHPRVPRPHYSMPANYFPSGYYKKKMEQRVPYTMLMPPPVVTKKASSSPYPTMDTTQIIKLSTTTPQPIAQSTLPTTQVTVQQSNLIYQSSSVSDISEWTSTTTKMKPPPESYIQISFLPQKINLTNKPLVAANSDQNINFVTAPPLLDEVMHKGKVSDDPDESDTYVKIGKTEAQVHSTGPELIPPMIVFSHIKHPMINEIQATPLTMQTIQSMQTMLPPPVTTSPVFVTSTPEPTTTDLPTTTDIPTTTTTALTTDPLFKHYRQPAEPRKGPLYLIIQGHSKVKTYGPTKQIHGISVQDSNEIYSEDEFNVNHLHFKDNKKVESRGSRSDLLTLKHVIETGLGKLELDNVDNIDRKYVETTISPSDKIGVGEEKRTDQQSETRKVSRKVRDVQKYKQNDNKLKTLKHVIQAGWGKIDFEVDDEKTRRSRSAVISSTKKLNPKGDVAETELVFGYRVGEGDEVTSERYYKGIVEEARTLELNKA